MIDMHTHTTASDGQYSPTELVKKAGEAGIELLAVTDHDTVGGLDEAETAAQAAGIEFICGIEISARYNSKVKRFDEKGKRLKAEMHILGYGIDINDRALLELCDSFQRGRAERVSKIYEFLALRGVDLKSGSAEKFAGETAASRPHFAQAMVEAGFCQTTREAFDKHLATPEFETVERQKYSPQESINAIRQAGGIAVLAHPISLLLDGSELKAAVIELRDMGLCGIEAYYSTHSKEFSDTCVSIANELSMLVTAGSDFHGENVKPNITLGLPLEDKTKEEIKANFLKAL